MAKDEGRNASQIS